MVHPLAQLNYLTDTELQEKLDDLNKKYWMASNPDVRNQIVLMLDSLKLEQENRQIKQKKEENQDNNLVNLINIS